MALVASPSSSIPGRSPTPSGAGQPAVLRLHGEHDVSTVEALAEELARVIASSEADVRVDLSGVTFMDASTVTVILRARQFLERRRRMLTLRSPTTLARRIIEICCLDELLDPDDGGPAVAPAIALSG